MEVIKAERVDILTDEDITYQFTVELMELEKVMVSVFNVRTGITYKTYIHNNDEWFKANIYIFRGDFSHVISILRDSLVTQKDELPHSEVEEKDVLHSTIRYSDSLYPFELVLDLPKHVSENGEIDDRLNSLEYQIRMLATKHTETKQTINNEIYNEVGNLIYKGEMKDGKRHGKGSEYDASTGDKLRDATFKDGYYDGPVTKYTYNWGDGSQMICEEGTYKHGKMDGLVKGYTYDGKHYSNSETTYENNVMNGPYTTWRIHDGTVSVTNKSTYVNGQIHGESQQWTIGNRQPQTFMYNMGKPA